MRPERMWAVQRPDKSFAYFAMYREWARNFVVREWKQEWKSLYRQGYRCVRVTVTVEGEE